MARDAQREESREERSEDQRVDEDVPNPNPAGQEVSPQQEVHVDPRSIAAGYELADVNLRSIFWFGGTLLVGVVIVHIVLFFALRLWTDRPLPLFPRVEPVEVSLPEVPGPGLDAAPEYGLQRLLEIEAERLSTYGQSEGEGGNVRIPIERAMQMLVENGVPAQDGAAPDFRLDPAFRMDSSGGIEPIGEVREESGEGAEGAPGDSATEDVVTDDGATGEDATGEDTTSEGTDEESESLEDGPAEGTDEGDAADGAAGGASTEEGVVDERDEDD